MSEKIVRIGGASVAMGDSSEAVPQLLRDGKKLDYLIFDYMSEGILGLLAQMSEKDPLAFPTYFLDGQVGPYLHDVMAKGVKLIANAGGNNPSGLAKAIEKFAAERGLKPRIAIVEGDDLRHMIPELKKEGYKHMFSGAEFPDNLSIANAYLGAFPIAAALAAGADIVLTGRVVDSATTLGALIHEFGWKQDQYDLLAAGTLIGHLLECSTMVTGGTHTDWRDVPDWHNTGYPIGECKADGTCVITKVENTGGLVSVGVVAEQMLYEVSDPQSYFVPDVTCDFSEVKLKQVGENRVLVSNAKGYPPTSTYKVTCAYQYGWRAVSFQPVLGFEAVDKANRIAEATFTRINGMLRDRNLGEFSLTHKEVMGAEETYGAQGRRRDAREVMLRMVVEHKEKPAMDVYAREVTQCITAMSVGTAVGFVQSIAPAYRVFLFLMPKTKIEASITFEGKTTVVKVPTNGGFTPSMMKKLATPASPDDADPTMTVPLIRLAWARSGDKGNLFNVAVIARKPEYLPYISAALTIDAVANWYKHLFEAGKPPRVERFEVPGVNAVNMLVHDSLGGGSVGSARMDAFAKGMGQQMLEFPIPVSKTLHAELERIERDKHYAYPKTGD